MRWLLDHAGVDQRWCLVHATHMDPGETRDLARSGAAAGLCPVTEANLGDGIFNAADYIHGGGRYGVGTDSNVAIGVAAELRQLEYAQRLRQRARNVCSLPGTSCGRMMLEAALFKDIALVEVGALVAVGVAVLTQIAGDLAYRLLDPRIRT